MYIFFGSTGAVSSIDIDDEDLVQGSVNVNNLYAYHVGKPNLSYTATVVFERSDGELSPERTMTPYTFTYETVEYAGYHFLFDDEWILAKSGELKATIRLRNGAGAVLATGLITAPVEQSVYDSDPLVTITQYNDLQANLASKADKSQTIIHIATLANMPTLDGGEYDNWMFVLDDGTVYRIDTDVATFVGKIGESCKYVKSSEILAKGDVVQIASATGGFVLVKKAVSAEINVYPQRVLGLAMHSFTANGFGLILMQGKLDGINTSSGTDGAYIYADSSSATNGLWTITSPTAPNVSVVLGAISNASVNGTIDVRITHIPKFSTLSDVYAPVLAQDDVIKWNATLGRWEVTKELSVYKYLGTYATVDLAVTAITNGSTGVLYEMLVNGVPYEGIKTSGGVFILNLGNNTSNYYVGGAIENKRNSIYVYSGALGDSSVNTVPEIYRNSFRSLVGANSIGTCMIVRGSYSGTPTTEYAYIFFLSADIAIITVGARTWKYSYSADTFTEYYLTKSDAQSTYIALTEKGSANGVAPLGSDSKIASTYLPSYVDDILEYANLASFPATGETGKIYVALDTNLTYRWSGSAYVEISQSLALGETSSTAYRGDRGKIAYDHTSLTNNPHSVTKTQVGLGNVDNTSDANKPVSTAQQTALNAKAEKQPLLNKKANFLGDSITYGYSLTDINNERFTELVKTTLGLSTVRNYGVSGSRLATYNPNLIIVSTITDGYYLNASGVATALSTYCYTDYIPVTPSTNYRMYAVDNDGNPVGFDGCYYDASKNFLGAISTGANPITYKTTSGTYFVRLNMGTNKKTVSYFAIGTSAPDTTSFVNRYSAMDNDADYVFVFGGTNDYGHTQSNSGLYVPFGTFADRVDGTFYGGLHAMLSGLLAKYPTKKIGVLTPMHREAPIGLSGDDYVDNPNTSKNLKEYVDAIKEVAQYYGIPVLDFFSELPLNPNVSAIKTAYVPDGIHPNAAGHIRLAELISNFAKGI